MLRFFDSQVNLSTDQGRIKEIEVTARMTSNPYLIGLCEVAGDLNGSIAVLARCRSDCAPAFTTQRNHLLYAQTGSLQSAWHG
jgi:hypothetical protein